MQVIDESAGEIVYTLRIKGNEFRPKVFSKGTYTVRVGEQPDGMKELYDVTKDPYEWQNLAEDPEYAEAKRNPRNPSKRKALP